MSKEEYEDAADLWESRNFDWRAHQSLPFELLKKLRMETIPRAFLAGIEYIMPERDEWERKAHKFALEADKANQELFELKKQGRK